MPYYNIVFRSKNNFIFFKTDEDYFSFWKILLESLDRYGGKVLAAGLMSRHVHLLIKIDTAATNGFLQSYFSRFRYYFVKEKRLEKKERLTIRNGLFIQPIAAENHSSLRASIVYINRNFYKENSNIDLKYHPSSAIPLALAQFERQSTCSTNIFVKYDIFQNLLHVLDLQTLKRLFGSSSTSFINSFLQAHLKSPSQETLIMHEDEDKIDAIINQFLDTKASVRFYKSKEEKLVHLSSKEKAQLAKLLFKSGIKNKNLLSKKIYISKSSLYRYLNDE